MLRYLTMVTLILVIMTFLFPSTTTSATTHRRLLHQKPLFSHSLDQPISLPPSPSPQSQPTYPFSTFYYPPPNPQNSFFPSYSPPPPTTTNTPSSTPTTFAANISSLVVPSTSHNSSHKTISLVFALSLLSILILAAAFLFLIIRRRRPLKADKLRLFHPETSNSSSNNTTSSVKIKQTAFRLGSPELHPLPPLPRQQFLNNDDDLKFSTLNADVPTNTTHFVDSSNSCSPSVVLNLGSQRTTELSSPDYFHPPPPPPRELKAFSTFSPSSNDVCFSPAARFWDGGGPPELVGPTRKVVNARKHYFGYSGEIRKPMLKHWDKIRATSDTTMIWDHLESNTFQLNEEMIKTLFIVNSSANNARVGLGGQLIQDANKEKELLDPKMSHNIDILLKAVNLTIEEVCEAVAEGNGDILGTELLESLLKMAPTKDEEQKLKEFNVDSPFKLGTAETFLKTLVDIPFAFQRVDAMLYIANFDSEIEYLKTCFSTLEFACKELRSSRMFLKLLEAVIRTGNHMNVGTNCGKRHAFKLDTLLKLVDFKSTDGKTTLLHSVVQEIIKSEGAYLSGVDQNSVAEESQQSTLQNEIDFSKLGLEIVSGLSGELTNVKKAATMERDLISDEVLKLAKGVTKISEVIKLNEELSVKDKNVKFADLMSQFLDKAESEIVNIQAQEGIALSMVRALTEYFHGDLGKEEARPLRLFVVVRDFLCILDRVCKDVGKINKRIMVSSGKQVQISANPVVCGISRVK